MSRGVQSPRVAGIEPPFQFLGSVRERLLGRGPECDEQRGVAVGIAITNLVAIGLMHSGVGRPRLLANAADAERCWHIYKHIASVLRPGLAWGMLPLGLGVTETLVRLLAEQIEDDAPADAHKFYLDQLAARRDRARTAWHSYSASKEPPTHVH